MAEPRPRETGAYESSAGTGRFERWGPTGQPLVLLAHGAGAPYSSEFMRAVTSALVAHDLMVACFHFPYMEGMVQTGRRRPPPRAQSLLPCVAAMIERAASWTDRPPALAGKSMGGRVASLLLASRPAPSVCGAVYLGYPLHPAGKPERLRSGHLGEILVPQLFVSGDRDPLCDLALLRPILQDIPRARLHVVAGGDHSLEQRGKDPRAGFPGWLKEVAEAVASWQ